MSKKSILMIASLAMCLMMAISGTLAYLTDIDQSVNVMTLGNVDIEQNEAFAQGTLLMPAVKDGDVLKNTVQKEVSVTNTGKNDAYVRTVFAFEMGKLTAEEFDTYVHAEFNADNVGEGKEWSDIRKHGLITIAGKNYYMMSTVRLEPLTSKTESGKTLMKVYLDPKADRRQIEAVDGNSDGQLTVVVLSQGVQVEGFASAEAALNEAFTNGVALDTTNHPWLNTQSGGDLTGGAAGDQLVGDGTTVITSTYKLDNNIISNYVFGDGKTDVVASQMSGNSVINNSKFVAGPNGRAFWMDDPEDNATVTFNNCHFDSQISLGGDDTNKYIFNNCTFSGKVNWSKALITLYAPIELNGCTFDHSDGALYDVRLDVGRTSDSVTVTGNGSVIVSSKATTDSPLVVEVISANSKSDATNNNAVISNNPDGSVNAVVTKPEGLNAAVNAGSTVNVALTGAGSYTLPTVTNKDVTISGNKDTVIDTTTGFNSTNNADLTFDGVTVKFADANYKGFTHAKKVVYKNCTLIGQMTMYANTEFINCTFETDGNIYSVWTYGNNATFTNCTFNTDGKAVLVYNEGTHNSVINLTNCTFNDSMNGSKGKAAVETGVNGSNVPNITLNFTDCTVNGFSVNKDEEANPTLQISKFWGNKNNMDKAHLNVIIDGEDKY